MAKSTTAIQRIRQGVRALLAFSHPVDFERVASILTPEQMALFRRMQRSEQLHSVNVLKAVMAQESETPHDLQVAALLHDVGKVCYPLAIWQKTVTVLVRAFIPHYFEVWSARDPRHFWYRAFVVNRQHPRWSGELLTEAGATERAIWLVTYHAHPAEALREHPDVHLLERLQRADDLN